MTDNIPPRTGDRNIAGADCLHQEKKRTKTNPKNQSYKHRGKHGRGGRARERWKSTREVEGGGASGSAEPTSERWGVEEEGLGGGRRGRGLRER